METQSKNHYAAIRDAGLDLADAILDLADAQVNADNDKARIAGARSHLHDWIGTGKAPAMPPADLLFAIAVVLDTVELPGSDVGLGTEIFSQLCELGLSEPIERTAYAREPIPVPPLRPTVPPRPRCQGPRRTPPVCCCSSYYHGCRCC